MSFLCVFVFKNHGLKSVMLKNGFKKMVFTRPFLKVMAYQRDKAVFTAVLIKVAFYKKCL
ncbi:hypothetical protein B0182_07790 [Moraxella bovis]|nr:hypothetical protein DQF64_13605 [Moraxella bovis]OOR89107.1 hypothetical protein B0182_07790 [Moraxella bovis]